MRKKRKREQLQKAAPKRPKVAPRWKKAAQHPPPDERRYETRTSRGMKYLTREEALKHWREVASYCNYWVHEARREIQRLGGSLP